jgi:cystathionine beta-lyase/cystathionine gamma-synthase
MQSATKYLNGHSDVTAGVIAGPAALLRPIERRGVCSARSSIPRRAYASAAE